MKHRILGKLVSLVLCVALLVGLVPIMPLQSAKAAAPVCVVMGDSVPAGYGLVKPLEQGYVPLLANYAQAAGIAMTVNNLAVSGATTTDVLKLLSTSTAQQAVKQAQVVNINAGGNNLLGPLMAILMKTFGIADITKVPPSALLQMAAWQPTQEDLALLQAGVAQFSADFAKIIGSVRALAPKAIIVVNTLYNPAPKAMSAQLGMYAPLDGLITAMNKGIVQGAPAGGYLVADIYTAFSDATAAVTNFNPALGSIDIHPNAAGHALIANTIAKVLISALTPPTPSYSVGTTINATSVYPKASTKDKALGKLSKGNKLQVLGFEGDFAKIIYKTGVAYVPASDTSIVLVAKIFATTTKQVPIYQKMSTKNKAVATYKKNQKITLLERQGAWWKVLYSGKEGYIQAKNIQLL